MKVDPTATCEQPGTKPSERKACQSHILDRLYFTNRAPSPGLSAGAPVQLTVETYRKPSRRRILRVGLACLLFGSGGLHQHDPRLGNSSTTLSKGASFCPGSRHRSGSAKISTSALGDRVGGRAQTVCASLTALPTACQSAGNLCPRGASPPGRGAFLHFDKSGTREVFTRPVGSTAAGSLARVQ